MIVKERVPVPERDPFERCGDFEEVSLGYDPEGAIAEAKRCLNCKNKPCVKGCPIKIDIPKFIKQIAEGEFHEAFITLKKNNCIPGVTGRVCPQEEQCEALCTLGKNGEPVNIGKLERFVSDYIRENSLEETPNIVPKVGRIAIIGSGPSGLSCAATLAEEGYEVVVFEALHDIGGVLKYGIPEFRLPNEIVDYEIQRLRHLGVEFRTNHIVGKNVLFFDMREDFDAIYIATGAGAPNFLGIEGEELCGIYSANEFLTRINLMRAYKFPEYDTPITEMSRVAVIGCGNVAIDSARCAKRLGADVHVIYRRTELEAPARIEEIQHAKEEGVIFDFLKCPVRFIGVDGWLKKIELQGMEMGEEKGSGRRKAYPIENSKEIAEYDTVVIACGQNPNRLFYTSVPSLETTSWGGIIVDDNLKTSMNGVYAGGDAVTGAATVIKAMGNGRQAGESIIKFLRTGIDMES